GEAGGGGSEDGGGGSGTGGGGGGGGSGPADSSGPSVAPAAPAALPTSVAPAAPAALPPSGTAVAGTPAVVAPPTGAGAGGSVSSGTRIAPRQGTSSSPRGSGSGAKGAPTVGSSTSVPTRPVADELAPYDPRSEPAKLIGILVAAFTLLQLGGSRGGLALARGGGGVVRSGAGAHALQQSSGGGADYGGVDVEFLGAGLGAVALGDRSWTWTWPGTRTLDALSATLPARLARRSPLLARVIADGTYLRAILGSASLLGLGAGLALGAAALQNTGGDALPPVAALTIAIAVLGVLDAAAGLVAVLIFTTGVLVLGGVDSLAHLRLMLGLSALWFVVPVLAGAARPLRRPPTRSLEQSWDRAADFVIASLIGA
ncbi:MAG: hypothetical protein QOJ63_1202, partial [Solirubrobacteraceae bacterium]|nr:hypothetical protein [Solirubrobacteraceae bacterium]